MLPEDTDEGVVMEGDKHKDRSVDDCCVFCGDHPFPAEKGGGHWFEGVENKDGYYEVAGGYGGDWLVIEHILGCFLWVCPECRKRCGV